MKFIYPKNYNYNLKLLGFISYSTAIIDVVLGILIFCLVNFIFKSNSLKIYFFIWLYIPVLMFSILGISKESFLDVIKYLFKYIKNRNIYLYDKTDKNSDKYN